HSYLTLTYALHLCSMIALLYPAFPVFLSTSARTSYICTLSLHDALPIYHLRSAAVGPGWQTGQTRQRERAAQRRGHPQQEGIHRQDRPQGSRHLREDALLARPNPVAGTRQSHPLPQHLDPESRRVRQAVGRKDQV